MRSKKVWLYLVVLILGVNWSERGLCISLWQERELSGKRSMFVDRKAHRIGDIVTILIQENSSATSDANTDTKRESDIKDEVKSWIKVILNSLGILPDIKALKVVNDYLPKIELSADHQYKSEGTTTRSQKLQARLSAKIVEILPNGNYILEGKQDVLVNGEKQTITITGEVRPDDITSENTVVSSAIANAKIVYSGSGTVGDKQKKGLLEWIFDLAWLF